MVLSQSLTSGWMKALARSIGLVMLSAFVLVGCRTGDIGKDFDASFVPKIEKNVTTKAEIRQHLGEPLQTTTSSTGETWTYQYTNAYGASYTRVATWGIVDEKVINKMLIIVFNGDVVTEYQYTQ